MLQTLKTYWAKTNRWYRVLAIILIVELNYLPGGQVGFYCNDPALAHPFTGDTINWKWLLALTLTLPLPVLLFIERQTEIDPQRSKERALHWYKEYLFGFVVNLAIVQTLKLVVGSPRPHFFDTCSPKESMSCEGSEYVHRYTCTKAHYLTQSDRSFPSGHSALAAHAGMFIVYYLYLRRDIPSITRTVVTLQAVFTSAAVFCAVSRMWDHRHHWWDVLAGTGIAVPILCYVIYFRCNNFTVEPKKEVIETNKDAGNPSQLLDNSYLGTLET